MKVLLIALVLYSLISAKVSALKCVSCSKVGPGNWPEGTDCSNNDNLPEAKECINKANDICVFTHMKPINGSMESWVRECGQSKNYDDKTNTCQSINFFGRKMTTCVCNKVKDDPLKACNGAMGLSSSNEALTIALLTLLVFLFRF